MTIYHLYVKTHLKTGLKYLGYTKSKDPHEYRGSGKWWKRHLTKHGNDVWTNIIFQTEIKEDIKEVGLYYSELWNIVESDEWANLKKETGDGGFDTHREETKRIIREKRSRQVITNETRMKMSLSRKGRTSPMKGRRQTEEHKKQISNAMVGKSKPKIICPYCGKEGGFPQMKQWHFDKCKEKL